MKIVVLDAATLGADLDLSPLYACGNVIVYAHSAPDEVATRVMDADAVILNKVKIGEAQMPATGHEPHIICIAATGFDNVDLTVCRAHHVAVANVRGYSTDSVAQVTVGLVLALVCRLPVYCSATKSGDYTRGGTANRLTPAYHEVAGMTWGVLGAGKIGAQVAAVAAALGCRVLACRRHPDGKSVDSETLFHECDIITIHTPLTPETRGFIGAAELAAMKPGVILVNMARGAVTDEQAVADAVLSGHLGAFGADVYSVEPYPESHPFTAIAGLSNVLLTPHMSWGAVEARERCLREMIANLQAFMRGETRNRVDI